MQDEIHGIGGNLHIPLASESANRSQNTSRADGQAHNPGKAPAPTDTLTLTLPARQIQAAVEDTRPELDSGRVAAARESLANGSFEVNPDKIAQKLAQFEAYLPTPSE